MSDPAWERKYTLSAWACVDGYCIQVSREFCFYNKISAVTIRNCEDNLKKVIKWKKEEMRKMIDQIKEDPIKFGATREDYLFRKEEAL